MGFSLWSKSCHTPTDITSPLSQLHVYAIRPLPGILSPVLPSSFGQLIPRPTQTTDQQRRVQYAAVVLRRQRCRRFRSFGNTTQTRQKRTGLSRMFVHLFGGHERKSLIRKLHFVSIVSAANQNLGKVQYFRQRDSLQKNTVNFIIKKVVFVQCGMVKDLLYTL